MKHIKKFNENNDYEGDKYFLAGNIKEFIREINDYFYIKIGDIDIYLEISKNYETSFQIEDIREAKEFYDIFDDVKITILEIIILNIEKKEKEDEALNLLKRINSHTKHLGIEILFGYSGRGTGDINDPNKDLKVFFGTISEIKHLHSYQNYMEKIK